MLKTNAQRRTWPWGTALLAMLIAAQLSGSVAWSQDSPDEIRALEESKKAIEALELKLKAIEAKEDAFLKARHNDPPQGVPPQSSTKLRAKNESGHIARTTEERLARLESLLEKLLPLSGAEAEQVRVGKLIGAIDERLDAARGRLAAVEADRKKLVLDSETQGTSVETKLAEADITIAMLQEVVDKLEKARDSAIVAISGANYGPLRSPLDSKAMHDANDERINSLFKERNIALRQIVDEVTTMFESGKAPFGDVVEARQRLMKAELEIARTGAERIEVLTRWLKRLNEYESALERMIESGNAADRPRNEEHAVD